MTSTAYDTNPPNYTDPSAADDISSLISTALAVQESFFTARGRLKHVNTPHVNRLLSRLDDTDEKYLRLLEVSRTSAAELYNTIQNFIDVAIPISLDTKLPVEDRVAVVKRFADKIAASAQQDLQQATALKENLEQLVLELKAIQTHLRNQSSDANDEQSGLAVVIPETNSVHPTTCHDDSISMVTKLPASTRLLAAIRQQHLDSISAVEIITSIIDCFIAPYRLARNSYFTAIANSRVPVTASPSETTAFTSAAVDEAVLKEISALVDLFSGLVGKLGHFGTVWEKLVADSTELSAYLSQGTEQDVVGNRVQAELGVYEKIRLSLDDYCLRTR